MDTKWTQIPIMEEYNKDLIKDIYSNKK